MHLCKKIFSIYNNHMIIESISNLQNLKLQIKKIYPIEEEKETKISLNNISTAFLCEL